MHCQDAPRHDLSVLSDAEVPRLYTHHVIKHKLQVQSALHTHLRRWKDFSVTSKGNGGGGLL